MTSDATTRAELVGLAAAGQALASPVEAYFEVANRCNSKCATCPLTFSPHEAARQLSLDEFKALVDQLPELRRAVLQGIGEPLLNRDLAGMIGYLKARGVYVVFNTNAALLTARRQVELIESGLDELRVSIDGSSQRRIGRCAAFRRSIASSATSRRWRLRVDALARRIRTCRSGSPGYARTCPSSLG
jgi:uncharacterized radical SAM superfamily Fe-S cluster-containing enzyme